MRKLIIALLTGLVTGSSLFGQVGQVIWEDNFNEGHLDLTKWSVETGTGVNGDWGTGQLDRATGRTENLSFSDSVPGAEDGCLVITTHKEAFIDRNYTSGRIRSAGKASWGPGHRIVARVYPRDVRYKGQGFAFWMMPDEIPVGWDYIMWPQGGEVDIMEYVGSIPYHNLGGVHYAWFWENNQWQSWNHGHQAAYYSYEHRQVPSPVAPGHGGYPPEAGDANAGSSGFHTYGIDWFPNRMEFFTDDVVYHIHYFNDGDAFAKDGQDKSAVVLSDNKRVNISEYSNHFQEWYPFEHKMYAVLSAGVGGSQYTYGGAIVPEAEFPCSVFIDWVRVFELDANVGVNLPESSARFDVFPNPASGVLNIRINNGKKYNLKIFDATGKCIVNEPFRDIARIDVSGFEKGLITVAVSSGKLSMSKKILIQ